MAAAPKRLNLFERYLTVWVGLCMIAGCCLASLSRLYCQLRTHGVWQGQPGQRADCRPDLADDHSDDDEGRFWRDPECGQKPRGLLVTLFVNWLVKPFSMALIAWVFFRHIFAPGSARRRRTSTSPAALFSRPRPVRPWSSFGAI